MVAKVSPWSPCIINVSHVSHQKFKTENMDIIAVFLIKLVELPLYHEWHEHTHTQTHTHICLSRAADKIIIDVLVHEKTLMHFEIAHTPASIQLPLKTSPLIVSIITISVSTNSNNRQLLSLTNSLVIENIARWRHLAVRAGDDDQR